MLYKIDSQEIYMAFTRAIILSHDEEIVSVCGLLGKELGMEIENHEELANFLLQLQDKDFHVAMYDCNHINSDVLKWVKIVRRIRPKIPLIIFSDDVDQETGGNAYDEGIFYLYVRPVVKSVLNKVIKAALEIQQKH